MMHFTSVNIYLMWISSQTYKAYRGGVFTLTRLLIPAWVVHYYVKYHVAVSRKKKSSLFVPMIKQMKNKQNKNLLKRYKSQYQCYFDDMDLFPIKNQ